MNINLFNGLNFGNSSGWAIGALIVVFGLWIWSIVVIAKEKTEDPFDRIVWLLIVLALNFLGTLLYFFFGRDSKTANNRLDQAEADIKRRANEGRL